MLENRHGKPGHYAAVSFANPDDYMTFIEQNFDSLIAEAKEGFRHHGRGAVLLKSLGKPFVQSQYVTPTKDDLDGWTPEQREDWTTYDPKTELVIAVTDREETFLQSWRLRQA